jgi:hypothetical protein
MSPKRSADESAFNTLCGLLAGSLAPHGAGQRRFVLLLGSGLHAPLLQDLERRALQAEPMSAEGLSALDQEARLARFAAAWRHRDNEACVALYRASERRLGEVIGASAAGAEVSEEQVTATQAALGAARRREESWGHLARLIAKGVFDIVLTTDIGSVLEDVLAVRHPPRSNVQVWVKNGVDPRELRSAVARRWPAVKILKLHGDLAAQPHDLLPDENHPWHDLLTEWLSGRVLVLGLDPIRDRDVVAALGERHDGELFYVAERRPALSLDIGRRLAQRRMCNYLTGPLAHFETFTMRLAERLVGERTGHYGFTDVAAARSERGAPLSDQEIERWSHGRLPLVELLPPAAPPACTDLVELSRRATLHLRYDDRLRRISFRVAGSMVFEGTGRTLDLDVDELNVMMRILGQDVLLYHQRDQQHPGHFGDWRVRAKREGRGLYRVLFEEHPELMESLGRARLAVGDRLEDLLLACEGPATHLGLPYELLQAAPNTEPWVAMSGLYRRLTGTNVSRPGVDELLTGLRREARPLRILMVIPERAGHDGEQESERLRRCFAAQANPAVEITELTERAATCEGIREALQAGQHVLHYYGHGVHTDDGENGGLWLNPGAHEVMCTRHLSDALRASSVAVVFLNTCVGALTAPAPVLLGHDHLGPLEAVASAGVPVVLGYRWWVRSNSATRFAEAFYAALFATHSAPEAVRRARRAIYNDDADDETWLSPVLISQRD